MKKQHVLALTGLFAAGIFASGAMAQVNDVGPFSGDESEDFEGPQVVFTQCMPDRVFNNTADLCTVGGNGCHTTTGWSFQCVIYPHGDSYFFGSASGYAEYTFDSPISAFGGYFGSNAYASNETPGGDVNFYDSSNNLIDSKRLDMGHCDWTWNGWETAGAGIARIEVINDKYGAFVMMDDMEINTGPAADCLTMTVDPLVGGSSADWNVSGATAGEQVAIVYGFGPGTTVVNGYAGYCATFGIQGVNQNKLICIKAADGGGNVLCQKKIPAGATGQRVLSQAAERNTCGGECVSNLDDQVVG